MTKPRKETLTQADLKRFLDYDPDTGQLTWRKRTLDMFAYCKNPKMTLNQWNAQFAGKPAFTADNGNGYLQGHFYGRMYRAHRVIVCWMTEEWPLADIDHKNGVRSDNRWENIAPVTKSENSRNQKMHSTNTSGYCGVCWDKAAKKYVTNIHNDAGKRIAKRFKTKSEAIAQRQAWEKQFGYSERHGK